MRRVAITGLGITSCLGNDADTVSAALREGRSGIRHIPQYAELGFRSQVGGAPEIDLEAQIDRKQKRFMGDAAAFAHIALRDAIVLANHIGPALLRAANGGALDAAAQAFEAERRPEVTKIQAQQNEATQRLGRMQAMAPFLRMIPSGLLAGLGRFLLSRSAIKRFIEGASRISLTFKPERDA